MPPVAREEYRRRVRIGYQTSNDGLRVTIPDDIVFPTLTAHCHLRDRKTLVVDQDRSKDTTWSVALCRGDTTPGCRFFVIPGVKNIGPHFRITPVTYRVDGPRLLIQLPDENDRRQPKRCGAKTAEPIVSRTIEEGRRKRESAPKATVLVDGPGIDMEFRVPLEDLLPVLFQWRDKKYGG